MDSSKGISDCREESKEEMVRNISDLQYFNDQSPNEWEQSPNEREQSPNEREQNSNKREQNSNEREQIEP